MTDEWVDWMDSVKTMGWLFQWHLMRKLRIDTHMIRKLRKGILQLLKHLLQFCGFFVGQKTHRKISQILQIFWNFSGLHGSQLWWLDMILHESCDIAHLFLHHFCEKKRVSDKAVQRSTPPCFSSREIFQSQVLEVPEMLKWWRKCTVQLPVFL